DVRVVADAVPDWVVGLATKRAYQLVLDVVRKIDVVPRQVVLEVMIAEVTLNNDLEFGIAYAISEGPLKTALPGGDPNASIFNNKQGQTGSPFLTGLLGTATRTPAAGAFAVISNQNGFNMFINALNAITRVKMLAAPHIIAADNREAHILVGQSVPILTSTSTAVLTGTAGTVANSIQYRDTGKILTVLPQVNSKGLVNLQVRQEVSNVLQQSFGTTNSPSFTTREAETTMVVQDGATVLIGGIIDDSINGTRTGVPYLMDVPVLGRFFRKDSDTTTRTELLITITPYVIHNREEARDVTDDFSSRIEGLLELRRAMESRRSRGKSAGRILRPDANNQLQEVPLQ